MCRPTKPTGVVGLADHPPLAGPKFRLESLFVDLSDVCHWKGVDELHVLWLTGRLLEPRSISSAGAGSVPTRGTVAAVTASPHFASGAPSTATMATSTWVESPSCT
jgi:hypothetical protein